MTDPAQQQHAQQNLNHSLNQRRDQRAADQLMQSGIGRMSDISVAWMELCQKQIGLYASCCQYTGETLTEICNTMGQMTQQAMKVAEETRQEVSRR